MVAKEVDWFPTDEVITNGFRDKTRAVMLVDVAGGKVRASSTGVSESTDRGRATILIHSEGNTSPALVD